MSDLDVLDDDDLSLGDLFRIEVETQTEALGAGLVELEADASEEQLRALLRAAHSLKGAARLVDHAVIERLAHALEDQLSHAARAGEAPAPSMIDTMLHAVDLVTTIPQTPSEVTSELDRAVDASVAALRGDGQAASEPPAPYAEPEGDPASASALAPAPGPVPAASSTVRGPAAPKVGGSAHQAADRNVRVGASRLDRLFAASSELEIASRPFAGHIRRLHGLKRRYDALLSQVPEEVEGAAGLCAGLREASGAFQVELEALDALEQRTSGLSRRLHQASIETRMRPFGDGTRGFSRMVRDVARSLGKEAHLIVEGGATPVDREVLEALEGPLTHLLRNAVDHGLEATDVRERAGKPRRGTIELSARHQGGELYVTIEDDGGGIERESLERKIVAKTLATQAVVQQMQDEEVWAFLFLPEFSTRDEVGAISGRGIGLDVVHSTLEELGGEVRIQSAPGRGARFSLRLPLTLAVTRALLVRAEGDVFAFPLARIECALRIPAAEIEELAGHPAVRRDDHLVGLSDLARVLDLPERATSAKRPASAERSTVAAVVIGDPKDPGGQVALRVTAFLGVEELALRPLDPAFGDLPDIAAGAVLADGSPVLVLDVPDLLRSLARQAARGQIQRARSARDPAAEPDATRPKRVLVVDDSLTVREIERAILRRHGYEVETAVDGAAGWTALRAGEFDLLVSDVDMPNLDGIGLVTRLRADPTLRSLPAVIVSYKDREEDRLRGLAAGADRYLTKGAFRDETFIETVRDLIGEAEVVS